MVGALLSGKARESRDEVLRREPAWFDSGWIGADADDDLDQRLAAEAEQFDPLQPHIMTALGPIAPEGLGPALVGDQILGSGLASDLDERGLPGRATLAVADDLRAFTDAGGGAIVVATTAAGGRDSRSLHWLATWTPAHLIAVTGGGAIDKARTPGSRATGIADRAAAMIAELTRGIDGTSQRAGMMLIELHHPVLSDDDRAWLAAAVVVARATGAAITLALAHQSAGRLALPYLVDQAIDTSRLAVEWRTGHDLSDAAEGVLDAGAFRVIDPLFGRCTGSGRPGQANRRPRQSRIRKATASRSGNNRTIGRERHRRAELGDHPGAVADPADGSRDGCRGRARPARRESRAHVDD